MATSTFRAPLKDTFPIETADKHIGQGIGKNPIAHRIVSSVGVGWKFQSDWPSDIDCLDACAVNRSDTSGNQVHLAGLDLFREEFRPPKQFER
jgi:hypothetical protein